MAETLLPLLLPLGGLLNSSLKGDTTLSLFFQGSAKTRGLTEKNLEFSICLELFREAGGTRALQKSQAREVLGALAPAASVTAKSLSWIGSGS